MVYHYFPSFVQFAVVRNLFCSFQSDFPEAKICGFRQSKQLVRLFLFIEHGFQQVAQALDYRSVEIVQQLGGDSGEVDFFSQLG